jgi:hypothetical protein
MILIYVITRIGFMTVMYTLTACMDVRDKRAGNVWFRHNHIAYAIMRNWNHTVK